MGRRPAHTGRRPSQIALGLKRSGRSGRPQRTALVARRLARRKPEPPPPAHLHDLVSNVQQLVRIVDDLAVDLDGPLRDQSAKLAVAHLSVRETAPEDVEKSLCAPLQPTHRSLISNSTLAERRLEPFELALCGVVAVVSANDLLSKAELGLHRTMRLNLLDDRQRNLRIDSEILIDQ